MDAVPDRPVLHARQVRRAGRHQGRRPAEQPGVKITIDIKEGKRAQIRQINIVGNEAFTEEDILEQFKLKTPNWLSWYKQDDRYSREELSGDLEKLRSFYLDRGYANFDIDVDAGRDRARREDIFITLNVDEGDVYNVSEIKIAGDLVVPEQDLMGLVQIHRGDIYSRKMITATTEFMALRLGQDGYAFAKVDPVPQENPETKEISLTFLVEPGNRAYVRNINFSGSTGINDEVLRREMRQMEGGYLSNAAVERSKQRLQRLPFIEKVEFETNPVPGTPDLVDVDFKIKEGLPGQFSGGIGYSQSQSFLLNGNFVHSQLPRHRQPRRRRAECRPVQPGLQHLAHGPVRDRRRRVAHDLGELPQLQPVHEQLLAVRHDDRRARGRLRLAALRVPVRAGRPGGAAFRPVHRPEQQRRAVARCGCRTTAIRTRARPRSACRRSPSRTTARSSTRS